jgi:hypothetical protein
MKEKCMFCDGTGFVCSICEEPKKTCTCTMNGVSCFDPVVCIWCEFEEEAK